MNYQQQLEMFISDKALTQAAVSRALGVSPAVVNQYLQGKYNGNIKTLESKIAAYLVRQKDKAQGKRLEINYVSTATAKRAQGLINLAHQECEAVVLYGQAGLGKTCALKTYLQNNPDAILIEADPGYTAKVLLQDIAAKVGADTRGSLHDLSEAIIGKLADSGRLIMIDEAELLPLRALECLRRLHDKAGVGLVLAGMPRLLINLKGKRGELVQLYSRMGFALNMGDTLAVDELIEIAQGTLDGDFEVVAELANAAKGNTRRLCKLLGGVSRMARLNNEPVNVDMVRQFKEMLIH